MTKNKLDKLRGCKFDKIIVEEDVGEKDIMDFFEFIKTYMPSKVKNIIISPYPQNCIAVDFTDPKTKDKTTMLHLKLYKNGDIKVIDIIQ